MTKEITKAIILQEIQNKFKLRDLTPEIFTFQEAVTPIYNIGDHVKHWESMRYREEIVVGDDAHSKLMCAVPDNERWRVRKVDVFNESGNFQITQLFFHGSATKHQFLYYSTVPIGPQDMSIFSLRQDIIMEPGELSGFYIYISNFVTGGYATIHMLKEVETIR